MISSGKQVGVKPQASMQAATPGRGTMLRMRSSQLSGYLLIAVGGAIGSVLRYHASILLGARPLTTFFVNLSGAFLIGFLASFTLDPKIRLFLGSGFLGGYTTFSAMQLEALVAARGKSLPVEALAILFGSVSIGYLACWSGYALGGKLR